VVGFIAPNEIFEFGALDDAAGLTVPEVNNGCASNENDESTLTENNGCASNENDESTPTVNNGCELSRIMKLPMPSEDELRVSVRGSVNGNVDDLHTGGSYQTLQSNVVSSKACVNNASDVQSPMASFIFDRGVPGVEPNRLETSQVDSTTSQLQCLNFTQRSVTTTRLNDGSGLSEDEILKVSHTSGVQHSVLPWSEQCEEAFQTLKNILAGDPVLKCPDLAKPFILCTDASKVAIGAVLSQLDDRGHEKPCWYASKTLTVPERAWSTTERECFAVVYWVKYFRAYLYGTNFTVVTDHEALKILNRDKDPHGKLGRWAVELQDYQFTVVHREGRNHANADAMTRPPFVQETVNDDKVAIVGSSIGSSSKHAVEEMIAAQMNDPWIKRIINYLSTKELPEDDKEARRLIVDAGQMTFDEEGRLCRLWWPQRGMPRAATRVQIVVPETMKEIVLRNAHDGPFGGHFGNEKTFQRIRELYYWPTMYNDVKQWVMGCPACQSRKGSKRKYGLLKPIIIIRPFELMGMDLMGPFSLTKRGNCWILVIADYFTKWVEIFALPDATAQTCAKIVFDCIICRYGAPERILSDNGAQFRSELVDSLAKLCAYHHSFTTPYHPQTDGLVERMNKTIQTILSFFTSHKQDDWDDYLAQAAFVYNITPHSSTLETPYFLMYGREPKTPLDISLKTSSSSKELEEWLSALHEVRSLVAENIKEAQEKYKKYYDKRHNEIPFKVGDKVLLHLPVVGEGMSKKFTHPWQGPFRIMKRVGDVSFELVHMENPKNIQKAHAGRLKRYIEPFEKKEEKEQISKEEGNDNVKDKGKEKETVGVNEAENCQKAENKETVKRRRNVKKKPKREDQDCPDVEVEAILDHRDSNKGREYLIRFKGFSNRYNEWVHVKDVQAPELLAEYEKRMLRKSTIMPNQRRSSRTRRLTRKARGLD